MSVAETGNILINNGNNGYYGYYTRNATVVAAIFIPWGSDIIRVKMLQLPHLDLVKYTSWVCELDLLFTCIQFSVPRIEYPLAEQ